MRDAVSGQIRAVLRRETKPQVLDRVSAVLLISGIALVCAIPVNRELPIWPQLFAARVGGALVQLLAALALRAVRQASWPRAVGAAVAAFSTSTVSTLIIALITDDPLLLVLVVTLTTIGTAVVLPWEVGPQIAFGAVTTICWLPFVGQQSANVTVGVFSALAASIYLASLLDRQRRAQKADELLRAGHEHSLQQVASDAEPRAVIDSLLALLAQQAPGDALPRPVHRRGARAARRGRLAARARILCARVEPDLVDRQCRPLRRRRARQRDRGRGHGHRPARGGGGRAGARRRTDERLVRADALGHRRARRGRLPLPPSPRAERSRTGAGRHRHPRRCRGDRAARGAR
jgi:hypothetical protein